MLASIYLVYLKEASSFLTSYPPGSEGLSNKDSRLRVERGGFI